MDKPRLRSLASHPALKDILFLLLGVVLLLALLSERAAADTSASKPPVSQDVRAAAGGLQGSAGTSPSVNEFQTGDAPEGSTWVSCTSLNVAVFPQRVHVLCDQIFNGSVRFFAVSTRDAAHTARVLSALTAGHVSGRTLGILYDPDDLSGASIGCQPTDCRLIVAVSVDQ